MTDVRDLLVRIRAVDTATAVMKEVDALRESINNSIVSLKVDTSPIEEARSAYEGLTFTTQSVNDSINTVLDTSNLLTGSFTQVNTTIEQTTSLSEKLQGVWSAVADVGNGVKNTVNGITDSINMASVAIGAIVGVAADKAFKVAALDDAVNEQFKNQERYVVEEYLKNRPKYVSEDTVKSVLISNKERGIGIDESTRLLNTLTQTQFANAGTWKTKNLSVENVFQRMNTWASQSSQAIGKGGELPERVRRQIRDVGMGEISKKDINDAYTALRIAGEIKGKTKPEDQQKIMRKVIEEAAKRSMKPIDWDNLSATQRLQLMQVRLEDLRDIIATKVIPVLVNLVDTITWFIEVINKIPGATTFLAYATVFGTIAVIASRLAGAFGVVGVAIRSAAGAMKMYQMASLGMMGLSGPKAALNAPLERIGNWARGAGLASRYNIAADGSMELVRSGLIGRMSESFRGSGSIISRVFATIKVAAMGMFAAVNAGLVAMKAAIIAHPVGAVLVLIGIIVLLAYKMGYLQRAWEVFAKSNIGKDVIWAFRRISTIIEDVIARVVELFHVADSRVGAGGLRAAFEAVAAVVGNVFEKFDALYAAVKGGNIGLILDAGAGAFESLEFLGPVFFILSGLFKILRAMFDFIQDPMKKIRDFLSWIHSTLNGLWKWLMKAIPGAEKESKRQEIEKAAKKAGLEFDSRAGVFKIKRPGGYMDVAGDNEVNQKLLTMREDWKKLPGFAEGIADAVKKGLVGMAQEIGSAIQKALEGLFPDFSPLTKALESLQEWVQRWLGNNPEEDFAEKNMIKETDTMKIYKTGEEGIYNVIDKSAWIGEGKNWKVSKANLESKGVTGLASGGALGSDGLIYGHNKELMLPAKVATSSALLNKLSRISDGVGTSGDSARPVFNVNFYSSGTIDQKTKLEFKKLMNSVIDDYMSKSLRHRQAH